MVQGNWKSSREELSVPFLDSWLGVGRKWYEILCRDASYRETTLSEGSGDIDMVHKRDDTDRLIEPNIDDSEIAVLRGTHREEEGDQVRPLQSSVSRVVVARYKQDDSRLVEGKDRLVFPTGQRRIRQGSHLMQRGPPAYVPII